MRPALHARISHVLFRILLHLYPAAFRARFGAQMAEDFLELYEDRYRLQGLWGALSAWGRIALDLSRSVPAEHRAARKIISRRASDLGLNRGVGNYRGTRWSRIANGSGQGGGAETMNSVISEVRYAIRTLVRRPGFSMVAIVTLGLAIGANTVLFSVVNGVLLRPLPYPDADRLVTLAETRDAAPGQPNQASYPNFVDWKERSSSFEEMGAVTFFSASLTGGSEPLRVLAGVADPGFMRAAGLNPVLGRSFVEDDNQSGAQAVIILSNGIWQQSFGSDPDVVGRALRVNGNAVEVIGVLPPGADFAESDARLWVPLVPSIGNWVERRDVHVLTVLARLAPGVEFDGARQEMERLGSALQLEFPEANALRGATAVPLRETIVGAVQSSVLVLMGMVGVVLLIACANVANLLLAHFTSRGPELALRRALGAGRWQVTRIFLTESLLLTLAGGAVGVGLAFASFPWVMTQVQDRLPRVDGVTLNGTVLGFALLLSVATGLVFGVLPAMKRAGSGLGTSLAWGRGEERGGRRGGFVRVVLSGAQVAGSVVLLIGAGLLMRSFARLQAEDVGFEPNNLATVAVSLSGTGRSTEEVIRFYRDLPERLEALPGVRAASAVNALPISGGDSNGLLTIEGRTFAPGQEPAASFRRILPDYFRTVGTPVLHGREFRDTDVGEPFVTIISESMARAHWDTPADAVGVRIKVGSPEFEPWLTVVGVVGDVRNIGLGVQPALATYEPHAQRPWSTMSVVIRTDVDPASLTDAVRSTIHEAGGEVPVFDISTLTERITESLRPRRLTLALTGGFALLALVIASVGVYGVLAYSVSRRTRELGVRMALGASRAGVIRLVVTQGVRLVGGGLVVGLVGAALLGNALSTMLYGVSPLDGATFMAVPVLLALVAAVACYVPARRATLVDPVTALRED